MARVQIRAFFFELAAVGFDNFQRQQHVVQGGAPRQQRWRLKRHATDLERTVDHLPTHMDAALGGAAQTCGELHEGDLPQPEGPTMAMNSPCLTWRLMSSTAKWFCANNSSL
jgi:hypothetical protein